MFRKYWRFSSFDVAEDAKDGGKLEGSQKLEALLPPPASPCLPPPHPPASLLGSSRGGTDLSRSWRRDVVFPPRSSGRHRRSFCRFTMDLWTKRAAGIVVLVALLLSRMTAEGEHSFPAFSLFYFSSPGGDGGSPGCADPEGIAFTGALWMTRDPRFCCFQVDIWTVSDSVLLKLDNCCLVHEYFKIWKFSLNKKTRLRLLIVQNQYLI